MSQTKADETNKDKKKKKNQTVNKGKRNLFHPQLLLMCLRFWERHRDNRMWAEGPLLTVWAGGGM